MFPKIPSQKRNVYLDHAAATPLDARVLSSMKPYFSGLFANPSSLYSLGVRAQKIIECARKSIADVLGVQPDTVYFTSGGTESNNLALLGTALASQKYGKHIITTRVEHDSVLQVLEMLVKKYGFKVTYLPVDECGFVSVVDFKNALRKDTVLVSIMYANNEIGTIEPLSDIGREILKWRKNTKSVYPYFHTDAAQATNSLDLFVEKLHVDLMTLNGSKIYGPKGVGALYRRRGVVLEALTFGGKQEKGVRAGTENVPGIVGFARALELVRSEKEKISKELVKVRAHFWNRLQKEVPDIFLNGPELESQRLLNNLNVYFKGVESEALVLYLDSYGIFVSSGSACSTESNDPSHVLKAIGCSDERALSSVRFSLGKDTTKQDIDYVMKYLPKIVGELRKVKNYEKK